MALLLCIALIWYHSKFHSPCSNFTCSVLHVCCIAESWLPQGTILVNSCNSGDKCNCQKKKCFFVVWTVRWHPERALLSQMSIICSNSHYLWCCEKVGNSCLMATGKRTCHCWKISHLWISLHTLLRAKTIRSIKAVWEPSSHWKPSSTLRWIHPKCLGFRSRSHK